VVDSCFAIQKSSRALLDGQHGKSKSEKQESVFLSAFPQKVFVVTRVLFVCSKRVILHSQWSVILRLGRDSVGKVARRIVGNYPASFGEQTVNLKAEVCGLFKWLNIAHSPPLPCGCCVVRTSLNSGKPARVFRAAVKSDIGYWSKQLRRIE
jgi:hypothetical protein